MADFTIVMAITDKDKGAHGGMSAFLVDRDTPGLNVVRRIPMIGGHDTYELELQDCRVPGWKLLGEEGKGVNVLMSGLDYERAVLAGGPTGPTSQSVVALDTDGRSPDPYALIELGRDLRPGDYAVSFVNLANSGAPVASPITVASSFRPKWLAAVAEAPGVVESSLADALDAYA